MDLSHLIKKHFPFETFNPGQYEAIEKILNALLTGKRHVIAEMPTGIGKSVTAYVVAKVLRELKETHRTTIITGTTGLQDQYTADFPEMFDLRGKTRYNCPKGVGPYNSVGCRQAVAQNRCAKATICPYFKTRNYWCNNAELRITNTSFQIEACPSLVMEPQNKANLIIVDECHELPSHLITHNTIKLSTKDFYYTKKVIGEEFVGELIDLIDSYSDIAIGTAFKPSKDQRRIMEEFNDLVSGTLEQLDGMFGSSEDGKKSSIGGAIEEIQQIADKVGLYTDSSTGEWILTDYARHEKLELKPVYAFQVSNHGVFRKAEQFVHMSATICGFEQYRKNLGINDSYEEIVIENPIPKENRPVKLLSNIQVSGTIDYAGVAKTIDAIVKKHGNENGVIHTVSFKLAEEIKKHSQYKSRMIISNDRKEILSKLKKYNSGVIILSPSITTGYDFKGQMALWGVIAKVPYLSIGDPYVKLNMERNNRWYAREAILKIVQACGRIVRGTSDYGVNYVIDSNINRLIRDNYDMFPDWFLDGLVVRKSK